MSAFKLLAAVGVVCLLAPAARADEKDYPKLIVGKWEVIKAEEGVPPGAILEFTKDGKIMMTGKKDGEEVSREATYKLDGKKLTVTTGGDGGKTTNLTITKLSDTEMAVESDEGKRVELKKK